MRSVVVTLALFALAPLTLAACASTPTTNAQRAAGPFVDELSPYGDWWWSPGIGWVFSPYAGPGWAPYTFGRWGWSALDGWAWLSDEPFGWATYHYGRWIVVGNRWAWLPGDVWAPAWVEWRHGPGVVGWAPVGVNHWVFVRDTHLLEPRVGAHRLRDTRAALASSRVVHRPVRDVDGRMLNPGVSPRAIERATGERVTAIEDDASMQRRRVEEEMRARDVVERLNPVGGHLRDRDRAAHEDAFGGELERERARERAIDEARRVNEARREDGRPPARRARPRGR